MAGKKKKKKKENVSEVMPSPCWKRSVSRSRSEEAARFVSDRLAVFILHWIRPLLVSHVCYLR